MLPCTALPCLGVRAIPPMQRRAVPIPCPPPPEVALSPPPRGPTGALPAQGGHRAWPASAHIGQTLPVEAEACGVGLAGGNASCQRRPP